ncbi:pyruvate kinase 2, cytosolic-like [Rhododendron vialii]|uniref:pyruvate kinase 2, cytosolic-like n=1 Tax=Rhododendron vialii TaxID=182163 RepID=UPI00265E0DEC|nr:pyruvate kinase 2, cytosolic-like [Rhododendron vialii]
MGFWASILFRNKGKELRLYCWSTQVMLDTMGSELQVVNNTEKTLQLQEHGKVILTPDHGQEASSEILPINFSGLSKAVKKGDTIFVGHYLCTGSETTSVWLEVDEVREEDVVCVIKNIATLTGSLFTLHASQVHIDLPTLSDKDKEVFLFQKVAVYK